MSIALLLAAGKGTRMRSALPKPIVPFQGKPIVVHLIDSFKQSGVHDIYLIVGHGAEEVKEIIGEGVHYVYQKTQRGTADAVQQVRFVRQWTNEQLFVFVGDSPLITADTITRLETHHLKTNASCTFLTALFPIDLPYARVIKNEKGELLSCVEEKNATAKQLLVRELLSSHFIFKAKDLFDHIDEINADKDNQEFYLTDIIGIFLKYNLKVETLLIENYSELVGLNTPEDIQWAESTLHS